MELQQRIPARPREQSGARQPKGPGGWTIVAGGLLASLAFCGLILLGGAAMAAVPHPPKTGIFQYYWVRVDPNTWSRATAWGGYVLHQLAIWLCIYLAQARKTKYTEQPKLLNWMALGVNALFILLHFVQSQLWYDGLAQDVPEITALGVVAFMLMMVIAMEAPRRGLAFGIKVRFDRAFLDMLRKYHGYIFSMAIIYTFWYHPMEATQGHLPGFFYMFILLLQSSLFFMKIHVNRIWTFIVEFMVLPHSVFTALMQNNSMMPMFLFGFLGITVIAQIYGLGLRRWAIWAISLGYIAAVLIAYVLILGEPARIQEIIRIPLLDYLIIGLTYLIFMGCLQLARLFRGSHIAQELPHA